MASMRRHMPVVQIFNDPPPDHNVAIQPSTNNLHAASAALQNVQNIQNIQNIPALSPPAEFTSASPQKQDPVSSSPHAAVSGVNLNFVKIPPPDQGSSFTDHLAKKPAFSTFNTQFSRPPRSVYSVYQPVQAAGKENYLAPNTYGFIPQNVNYVYKDENYGYKAPLKRAASDAAPLREQPINKRARVEDAHSSTLPRPEDLPAIQDDGKKPNYSYAMLIGMAILRAPNRRLTLAQIYKWIQDNFDHYKGTETGWQNSIRHNLSLNKAFVKRERPRDDPGKGNYWAIEPGQEGTFLKDKPTRKAPTSSAPHAPPQHFQGPPRFPAKRTVTFDDPVSTVGVEPSSDATIPASDLSFDLEEDVRPRTADAQSTPPPVGLHSSPPIVHHGTPPLALHMPPAAKHMRSRVRRPASMNDSGYFSSLESSVARPNVQAITLSSEGDITRSREKRGGRRAQDEIARIRHSSHDSPSKGRTVINAPHIQVQSSSPLRQTENTQMLPPLTPLCTFKAPTKAPQTVSPNTNLLDHRRVIRDLVGSPEKGLKLLQEDTQWSPAFPTPDYYKQMDLTAGMEDFNSTFDVDRFNSNFDIFDDAFIGNIMSPGQGSPSQRRSARRPQLNRASTVLGEVTGSARHAGLSNPGSPFRFSFNQYSPSFSDSPLRPSPLKLSTHSLLQEELFNVDNEVMEQVLDSGDKTEQGLDILAGFQKIGAQMAQVDHLEPVRQSQTSLGHTPQGSPAVGSRRLGLSRSLTTQF
ncbi:MAG: hypothetical protein M1814_003511 [Vezdaea aestivalis]|nr:MAG: hypothetical protein M1814_003511 [Vezdaea aestivalis]